MASAKDESAPCETDRRLFDDPHVVLSGQRPDVQDAIAFEQMQPLTLVGFTETGGPGALTVAGTQADSLRTHLGGRVAFAGLEDGRGRIWSP